jgi:hypothetical protein
MELLYNLLKCVDTEKQKILGFTETQTNEAIFNFYAMYVLFEGNPLNISRKILELRKNGVIDNTDFIIKSLVVDWINIPFNYSDLQSEVYTFLQESSNYLLIPKRFQDISSYSDSMRITKNN